ncbi:uncharacterized protein [Musca autumnalis]|uniref:uncharacterized protein n=1 Tax=Musca autumnalis TaxID=221902 RepID=UPI003CF0748A
MKVFVQLLLVVTIFGLVYCKRILDHNAVNQKHYREIMNNLYEDVSPCNQFYPYVCNKWIEQHSDANYTSMWDMILYNGNMEIKKYFENTPRDEMPNFVKMTKNFYDSCMGSKEFISMEFMHWLEKEENMTWALLTPLNKEGVVYDWTLTMATFRKYGFNDMLAYHWLGSFEYIIKDDIYNLDNSITLPSGAMDFVELWEHIDEFENKLIEILVKTQGEVIYKFKELPYEWLKKYVTALMGPGELNPNMELSMKNGAAIKELDKFLMQYEEIFLCRYLEVRFLLYLQSANKRQTSNDCMVLTTNLLTPATEWIHSHLHPELVQEIPQIQQMFEDAVKNVNKTLRMSKKEGVIPQDVFEILETVRLQVGNLPLSANTSELLESFYKNLQLQADDFYGNYMKILKFHYDWEPRDKDMFFNKPTFSMSMWNVSPLIENGQKNLVILPFAILRPPFYHATYENIFKQSSLGTSMIFDIFELFRGIKKRNSLNLSYIARFASSFEIYFSSLRDEEAKRIQTMFGMTSLQQLKKMFFVNGFYLLCEKDYPHVEIFNYMLEDLTEFGNAFDCKF